jgi:hypothetical protein
MLRLVRTLFGDQRPNDDLVRLELGTFGPLRQQAIDDFVHRLFLPRPAAATALAGHIA